ncbi:hypothetical protein UFOVP711_4 [uncultured Caudovirales phage]|uniref:Bacteriophage VT1-Sakai, H0018 n=1 Tax=uncultured Caudovirales phage TaxID=2100421 RepID=A0A6J5NGR4_9CAUD|nr:hypothetical protein UFOVP711_4 [uncultured Caudovirales phage]
MAYEIANSAVKITLVAGEDLSAKQYYFVKINTSGQAMLCSGATDKPIGVLQNDPASGEEAVVTVVGGSKVVASASIDEGVLIGTASTGKADAKVPGTDTTEYVAGTVILASGADGEILTALINCANVHRAS